MNVYTRLGEMEKGKELVLLNFEDDTFRPVIKIDDATLNIIKKWYETCGQLVDVETTEIILPNVIAKTPSSLKGNINYKHKNMFLTSYVPEILKLITMNKHIKDIEVKLDLHINNNDTQSIIINNTTISIDIPKNMIYNEELYYYNSNKCKEKYYTNFKTTSASIKEIKYISTSMKDMKDIKDINYISTSTSASIKDIKDINYISTSTSAKDYKSNVLPFDEGFYHSFGKPVGSYLLTETDTDYKIGITNIDDLNNEKYHLIFVLINPFLMQTVSIINPDYITLNAIYENTAYGFTNLFTIESDNGEIDELIQTTFNGKSFDNIEELKEVLLSTSQLLEFHKQKRKNTVWVIEEEKNVKEYLTDYFDISEDHNYQMKASILYEKILISDKCDINKSKLSGFRNRLSNYLKEMGLKKKRYNDGYYYFGIVEKKPCDINFFSNVNQPLHYNIDTKVE
jgi:hypothetical protein